MRLQKNKLGKVSITVDEQPWTSTKCYRKLTIVREPNAYTCHISIKSVPKGIDLTDTNYWFVLSSLREDIQLDFNRIVEAVNSKISESEKGNPNGVATLDNGGKVVSTQLPSYVDDIIDIIGCYNYYDELYRPLLDGKLKLNPTASDFTPDTKIPPTAEPGTYYMALYHTLGGSNPGIYHYVSGMTWTREYGETGKIYVENSTNKQYRFVEGDYIPHEVVASPGTTDDVIEGSTNKYFTENRARAAVGEAILQRELLVNKVSTIREAEEADNTKYPTEKAVRTAIDSKKTSYNDLEFNLQGKVDDYDGHIGDAPDMSAKSRGLYKIAITEHGHVSGASGSAPTAVAKSDLTNLGVEDTSNKVTSIDNNSTNAQYPSAKCVYNTIATLDVVYDVSAHNNGATFASLSALLNNENINTLIPNSVRKGGMSIKFVQSSDNKYVQYFLNKDEWSANAVDWQKLNLEEEVKGLSWYQKSQKEVVCSSPDGYTRCDFIKDTHYRLVVKSGSLNNVAVFLRDNSSASISQRLQFIDGVADFICNYDGIKYISLVPATNVTFELYEYEYIHDFIEGVGEQVSINTENIEEVQNQLHHVVDSKRDIVGTSQSTFIPCALTKNVHYALIIKEGTVADNVWLSVNSSDVFKQKLNFIDGVADFVCNIDNINYIYNAPATNVIFELITYSSLKKLSETVCELNTDDQEQKKILYDSHLQDNSHSYTGNGTVRYISLSDIGYEKGKVYFIANSRDLDYRVAKAETSGGTYVNVFPTWIDNEEKFGYYDIDTDYIVLTDMFISVRTITFIHPLNEKIKDVKDSVLAAKTELEQEIKSYVKVYDHGAICSFVDDDMTNTAYSVWNIILTDTGIRVGFACTTGKIGTPTHESLANVKALYDDGNEIYSHSWSHDYAFYEDTTTPEIIEEECWKSKTWLLNNGFLRNADIIVYPGGLAYNQGAKEAVIRRHFRYGVDSMEGTGNADPVNKYHIFRVNADTATLEELKAHVDSAITNNRLLVFMTHSGLINSNEQIQKIESLIQYIQESETLILPLQEALNQIYGYEKY